MCLKGIEIITPEGKKVRSMTGNAWHESPPNGHHKKENPLGRAVVYQAQTLLRENGRNGNGRKPTKISGEVRIPAEVAVSAT
ncbi:hypothetical protein DRH13_00775 [Candidatus Woesebacteria bacterium]|nr:MAG: hypothetical protein DRH13_00775 [Candidatus Woesebacteria bacterium]